MTRPVPRRYLVGIRCSSDGVAFYDCGEHGDRWEWSFRGRGVFQRFVRLDLIPAR